MSSLEATEHTQPKLADIDSLAVARATPQGSRCWFLLTGLGGSELRASCWPCLSLSPPAALGGHRGPCPGSWPESPLVLVRALGTWENKAAAACRSRVAPRLPARAPSLPWSLGGLGLGDSGSHHRAPTCWQGGAQAGARSDPLSLLPAVAAEESAAPVPWCPGSLAVSRS